MKNGYQPKDNKKPPKPPKTDSNATIRYEHSQDAVILGKTIRKTKDGVLIKLTKEGIDYFGAMMDEVTNESQV